MEANLFFTFFGLDAIHKARHEHIKLATVANPGLRLATWAGGLAGITKADLIDQVKDIITVGEFYDMAAGGEIIFT